MTVRDKVGRQRYVVFAVQPPVGRERLAAALRAAAVPGGLRLVDYDGSRGLVRCDHTSKEATLAFLRDLRIGTSRVRTMGTSGTIRKARLKYLSSGRGGESAK